MARKRKRRSRDGCSEGELEVNRKFKQCASFTSLNTGSESSLLPSTWTVQREQG